MILMRLGWHVRSAVCVSTILLGTALLGIASSALAQTPPASDGQAGTARQASTAGAIEVSRLPVALDRIQRQLRRAQDQTTRNGLSLSYLVQVYALAPPLVIFTDADRAALALAPGGGSMHSAMFTAVAPSAHRASTMMAFRRPKSKSK